MKTMKKNDSFSFKHWSALFANADFGL